MKRLAYFDFAAATPMSDEVKAAMAPYQSEQFYNPSASYLSAVKVRREVDTARAQIAKIIGARPAEIIFTSGATEANNLVVKGFAAAHPKAKILVSSIEHDSVLEPAKARGANLIPVTKNGVIDLAWLAKNIDGHTGLISVMLVNNELGSLQPLREVGQLVAAEQKKRAKAGNKQPIYLHTDAAQAANYLDLPVARLGVQLMSVNGGKIYGPKQTGFLYAQAGTKLAPQIIGGGQEYGWRAGTENVGGIIGLATAFALVQANKTSESARLSKLRQQLESQLIELYADVQINAAKVNRAPHLLSASFVGQDNERLMMELDERGVLVAVGSACSAGKGELSHVLSAIGLPEDVIKSTLRISLGRQTTASDIKRLIKALRVSLSQQ